MRLIQKTEVNTALAGKQATITGSATTVLTGDLTNNRALISNASGKVAVSAVTSTELGYLSGVTSAVQTQLDKAMMGTPLYAGFISGAGIINRDNGYYTFSIGKGVTGQYAIIFGTTLSTNNYTVLITPRVSSPSFASYSNQATTGFTVFTFNSSGTATDIGFSFSVILS